MTRVAEAVAAGRGAADRPARRGFILVADDSAHMRELREEVFVGAGYEVVSVPSGARALTHMRDRCPDLLITDLFMPGLSGFALRARMLRDPDLAGVPVIVLSAFWRRPRETLEAAEVLPKPLDLDRLLSSVERLVTARAAAE